MKNKYRHPTFWLPLLLSAIPVVFFECLVALPFSTVFGLQPAGICTEVVLGCIFMEIFLGCIHIIPLGLLLFIAALTLSVVHRVRFQDEAKAYRRLPLKVTLLVWLPTFFLILVFGFPNFFGFLSILI